MLNRYSTSEIHKNPAILTDKEKMPFEITKFGEVFATVVPGEFEFHECDVCGKFTSNIFEYKDPSSETGISSFILCTAHAEQFDLQI